jgi:hypothetical protein
MSWLLETLEQISGSQLESHTRHVLRRLMDYADFDTGRNARPSIETLAADTALSKRQVYRELKLLREGGWITQCGTARRGVVVYAITCPTAAQPLPDHCPTPDTQSPNQDPYLNPHTTTAVKGR